jgi:endonuclease-3
MNDSTPSAVLRKLAKAYPDARCALVFESPVQLLVSTILSAQCTDERVNKVTPRLFGEYRAAEDFAGARLRDIEKIIHSCGFYRQKAKSIRNSCRAIVERHGGEVPRRMADLVELAGVGRKTANVVLNEAFGEPAIAVDTHVLRTGGRLGWLSTATRSRPNFKSWSGYRKGGGADTRFS